jgi:hypothetical protein
MLAKFDGIDPSKPIYLAVGDDFMTMIAKVIEGVPYRSTETSTT